MRAAVSRFWLGRVVRREGGAGGFLANQPVGLTELNDEVWKVTFMDYDGVWIMMGVF